MEVEPELKALLFAVFPLAAPVFPEAAPVVPLTYRFAALPDVLELNESTGNCEPLTAFDDQNPVF